MSEEAKLELGFGFMNHCSRPSQRRPLVADWRSETAATEIGGWRLLLQETGGRRPSLQRPPLQRPPLQE